MGFIQDFKEFALKGNLIDMAAGIIIGLAFNKVVTSLINDVIMPPIGMAIGGVDFRNLELVLKHAGVGPGGQPTPPVAVRYGAFINTVIEFLIIALTVFVIVKVSARLVRMRQPAGNVPPSTS